jgi:hypothetical protein
MVKKFNFSGNIASFLYPTQREISAFQQTAFGDYDTAQAVDLLSSSNLLVNTNGKK